jgi:serine/threonine-protein kinase ATR
VEDPPANELLNSAIKTFDELIAVAKKKPKNNKKKMTINVRPNRHISRGGREDAIGIIVPTQLALTVTLPRNNGETGRVQGEKYAHVFGGSSGPVVIRRVESDAMVMKSKEKPKRIALVGEDGKTYYFLCKQENERKGDLRKDARMMEINTVVNRLLQHDDGGRTRQLRLRTYAVMCLSETCGLMEWVDNTATARSLIEGVDKKLGLASFSKRMQLIKHLYEELQADKESDLKDLAEKYEKDILQDFPPSFHRWFIEHFPDPSAWFEARITYSRSVATWSMVGHIVGLGDRHC